MSQQTSVTIDRRKFVARLLALCADALVVTGLGSPSYDVFAAGDSDRYFYLWGAMGGSTAISLGLALAQPERPVIAITGDGEQLMGIGGLATAGAQQPPNLTLVVLDNGHFGETGMQRSHTSLGTRLAQVARACGIEQAREIWDIDEVETLAAQVNARSGMGLAQVHIKADELPRALPPRDGVYVKNRFRQALGFAPQ
ncbi:aldehyde dehydrogenase [Cupriavidus sp. SHE]|jgi:thiamine pyrophosphate-dependent acetolactate synthase large subunit-like protein|uniref:Aldehyde dehydrogenase n=1 Tax=Cupriavidus metallidurans TaxID=119219 RepID=A0A482IU34_9BURK|nr:MULTISPECIES: thiamine pyrophosphate-dependent enzyme [Cupriavidus]KWR76300.1 aldehyde dehydrogenase [Cupriavidus sp. SHE]QBP11811.1 aldehyde dehydrogenase [Cupriavidus metallidurans]